MKSRLSHVPHVHTSFSQLQENFLLSLFLVVSLTFIAPLLSFAFDWAIPFLPYPLLFATIVVGGIYAVIVLLVRKPIKGMYISLIVTATFGANIPLTSTANQYPLSLGPHIWLIELPLIALVFTSATTESISLKTLSVPEYLLGGFAIWTFVVATIGDPPKPDTALYFSLFAAIYALIFIITSNGIRVGQIEFHTALSTFCVSIFGHVVFGLIQFLNQQAFGLSYLGESNREHTTTLVIGFFGQFDIGLYISSFTSVSYNLANLIVLVFPVFLAFALQRDGRLSTVALAAVFPMALVVRFSASDAARGGLLVAVIAFAIAYLAAKYYGIVGATAKHDSSNRVYQLISGFIYFAISLSAVLYPSGRSGRSMKEVDTASNSRSAAEGVFSSTGGSSNQLSNLFASLNSMGIPFFDLSTLGYRVQQNVVGLFLFTQNPIFGIGGANYAYASAAYGIYESRLIHNVFISLLAETGLPGFLLFLSVLVLVFWTGLRLFLSQGNILVLGMLSGLFGSLAISFWTHRLLTVATFAFPFWIFAGIVIGAYQKLDSDRPKTVEMT